MSGRGYCQTCRFWHANLSECRRYAPDPAKPGKRFPRTAVMCWCGDYKRKRAGYINGVPAADYWAKP